MSCRPRVRASTACASARSRASPRSDSAENGLRAAFPSEHPALGKRNAGAITNHDVVEHLDIDEGERLAQATGDQLIGLARFRDARLVIVREYHGGGMARQSE